MEKADCVASLTTTVVVLVALYGVSQAAKKAKAATAKRVFSFIITDLH